MKAIVVRDAAAGTAGMRLVERPEPEPAINDVAGALADAQVGARGGVVEHDHPRFGAVKTVASPLRVGEGAKPVRRAPFRGEHTDEVLSELCGYDDPRIAALREAGVFG